MECDVVRAHLAERLSQPIAADVHSAIEDHLRGCEECHAEAEALSDTWNRLGAVAARPADTERLRSRFNAMLASEMAADAGTPAVMRPGAQHSRLTTWIAAAAAAIVVFAAGLGAGRAWPTPAATADLATMRGELHELRQMVTLSLLQQQSASERLRGVTWTQTIEEPDEAVTSALLDALMHDPNVNVRLATVDALARFSARESIRRGAIEALPRQTSPLVQIALIDFVVESRAQGAADTLRRLSEDALADQAVRAHAAQGLAKIL